MSQSICLEKKTLSILPRRTNHLQNAVVAVSTLTSFLLLLAIAYVSSRFLFNSGYSIGMSRELVAIIGLLTVAGGSLSIESAAKRDSLKGVVGTGVLCAIISGTIIGILV